MKYACIVSGRNSLKVILNQPFVVPLCIARKISDINNENVQIEIGKKYGLNEKWSSFSRTTIILVVQNRLLRRKYNKASEARNCCCLSNNQKKVQESQIMWQAAVFQLKFCHFFKDFVSWIFNRFVSFAFQFDKAVSDIIVHTKKLVTCRFLQKPSQHSLQV